MIVISTDKKHYKKLYQFAQENTQDDRCCAIHVGDENSERYEIRISSKKENEDMKRLSDILVSLDDNWNWKIELK